MTHSILESKWLELVITTIVMFPILVSDLVNPFTFDVRMYHAQVWISQYYPFPQGLDIAWEIKPIGSRFIQYLLYKIGSIFAPFSSYEYEIAARAAAFILILYICWYFTSQFKIRYFFLFTALVFITPYNQIMLQPEWFAVAFALVAIVFLARDNWLYWVAAGCIVTFIFLLKGITIILVIPICIAAFMLNPKDPSDYFNALLTAGTASAGSLVLLLVSPWFPHVIPDMLASRALAHIGMYSIPEMLYGFPAGFLSCYAFVFVPCVCVGICALIFYYLEYREYRGDAVVLILLVIMWASSLSIIFFQSEFIFVYQYFVLALPAIFTAMYLNEKYILFLSVAMIIMFCLFSAVWTPYPKTEIDFTQRHIASAQDMISAVPDLKSQPEILYLDIGDTPYYIGANSSCRYVSALPFKRNSEYWNLTDLPEYQENKVCIMNYTGKYIIAQAYNGSNWMKENTTDNKRMFEKIEKEYSVVWDKEWTVFMRRESMPQTPSVFHANPVSSSQVPERVRYRSNFS